jgi:hypothetical protein
MRYWDKLAEFERNGFEIIVDKTYEDLNPRDCFDDSVTDIDEIIKDIDRGHLEWFMLRVRVLVEGHELSSEYLGGMLYEDPKECLTDGSAEDIIAGALEHAKIQVYKLYRKFGELNEQIEREGIA